MRLCLSRQKAGPLEIPRRAALVRATRNFFATLEGSEESACGSDSASLEASGWTVGSAKEFLSRSEEEAAFVELKLALADHLKRRRVQRGLAQTGFAKMLDSSQSRVAKMESGDRSVTLDLLVRSLLAVGATRLCQSSVSGLTIDLTTQPLLGHPAFLLLS